MQFPPFVLLFVFWTLIYFSSLQVKAYALQPNQASFQDQSYFQPNKSIINLGTSVIPNLKQNQPNQIAWTTVVKDASNGSKVWHNKNIIKNQFAYYPTTTISHLTQKLRLIIIGFIVVGILLLCCCLFALGMIYVESAERKKPILPSQELAPNKIELKSVETKTMAFTVKSISKSMKGSKQVKSSSDGKEQKSNQNKKGLSFAK